MDISGLVSTLLHDPRVQGFLITAMANFIATEVNKRAKEPISEELRFWLHPVYLVLSAAVAGLDGLQNGSLHVDAATVHNFLVVLITAVTTHLGIKEVHSANQSLKAKLANFKEEGR